MKCVGVVAYVMCLTFRAGFNRFDSGTDRNRTSSGSRSTISWKSQWRKN